MVNSGTAEQKQIVIQHSGINTASTLPMQELDLPNVDPVQLVDQLDAAAMVPQLNGITVEFYGLGDTAGSQMALSGKQLKSLKAFWEEFFNRAGADVVFHSNIVSGAPLTENGHTVTPIEASGGPTFVKLTEEMVAFQPDSVEFVDQEAAEAVLSELAEHIKGTNLPYVLAGSVAKVENSTKKSAQELSLKRAQAVKKLLKKGGVPSQQMVCVGLGYEDTSFRNKEDEAQNRCVVIISANQPVASEMISVGKVE